jgi:hypothetical protein
VPSTYSIRLVKIGLPLGLLDDGRHAHPHPHRPPPCGQDPPRPDAREPRVAASAGRPPTRRAAATGAALRPRVLGPACPPLARLGGGRLHRPTRDRHPVAPRRFQALLDREEPTAWARPPRRRPRGPSPHPPDVRGQPPVGRATDSRGAPGFGDLPGHGLQVRGPPGDAAIADLAHVPRQPPRASGLGGLLRRAHGGVQGVVRLRRPRARPPTRRACQRDRRPHGPVDGPAARGGVSVGHRAAITFCATAMRSTASCSPAECTPWGSRR